MMKSTQPHLVKILIAATLLAGVVHSPADTNTFLTPSFRGQAGTESAYWDIFSSAYNDMNSPNGVPLGGNVLASASITQIADPGAFLTGTGNIYDYAASTGFTLNESAGFDIGNVVLQTRTEGSPLDYSSILLTYDLGSGATSLAGTQTTLTDPDGGDTQMWTWDLSGLGNISSINITFNASAPSMSFDAATLDIQAAPEPGVMALLALGGVGLLAGRRFCVKSSFLK